MTDSVTVHRWFDRHLHARDGEMLETVLPCTLKQRAAGAVIMGNLKHPDETSTAPKALAYRERIRAVAPEDLELCMTLYLTDEITPVQVFRGGTTLPWRLAD